MNERNPAPPWIINDDCFPVNNINNAAGSAPAPAPAVAVAAAAAPGLEWPRLVPERQSDVMRFLAHLGTKWRI